MSLKEFRYHGPARITVGDPIDMSIWYVQRLSIGGDQATAKYVVGGLFIHHHLRSFLNRPRSFARITGVRLPGIRRVCAPI